MPTDYVLLGAKKRMIESLKEKGITDENVLKAFDKVDRHLFMDSFLWNKAYEETALKLPMGQTISHPYTVAFQSQLLQVRKGLKVLEIGTGSGFQAAILSAMGARVFTIERQMALYQKSSKLLEQMDNSIYTVFGDGFHGIPRFAPYDRIIVTCGASEVPKSLLGQLADNGIMVIPVGEESQTMMRLTKTGDGTYEEETFGDFLFVPMLKSRVTF
ncbi:MAG: protein-L-isoaspartate(D-aspartate) O-methyltransferase [Bacteroidales bacterium]|nr:protein-L-isoaspartate(D-aspartate) O-methyltransferase [Bacteroidales bacterium]